MSLKELLKIHQQNVVLSVGYLLVFLLAFGLGRITAFKYSVPDVAVEEVFRPSNNSAILGATQSSDPESCAGQIKGNINSKGEKIYHVPGGSFYNRTNPEQCFNTEEEARAAGFRKSSR